MMRLLTRVLAALPPSDWRSASSRELDEKSAATVLDEGIALEQQGRMDEALKRYEAAVHAMPTLARAHFNIGNILLDRGNARDALIAYEKALRYKPESAATHFNMGNALHQLGRHEQAVAAYSAAILAKPDFADAEVALCMVLNEIGKLAESAAHFRRAIDIDPDRDNPFFQQGLQLQDQKLLDQALACYRKALQIQPDHMDSLNNMGVILIQQGQWNAAVLVLRQGLTVNSRSASVHKNLGLCFLAQKQFEEAAECFRCEIKIQPDNLLAHINLGNALSEFNDHAVALICYDQALELNPASNEALFNRGAALLKLEQYEEANTCFLQVLAVEPSSAEAYNNLGFIKKQLLQTDEAIAHYQKALSIKPEFPDAHCNLGLALQKIGRMEEAMQCYMRALEINPAHAATHCAQGFLLHSQDKLEQAERQYRRAIELQPNFPDAFNNLGVVLTSTRRFEEAISCFRRALELKPDFASAYVNWAIALKDKGQISQALEHLHHAIELDPGFVEAYDNLLFIHNYLEDQPAELMRAKAKQFGEITVRKAKPFTQWEVDPTGGKKLRVGFVSGDLCNHPVGYFAESVISALSKATREQLEIVAYPTTVSSDEISLRIKACCADWRSAVGLSDEALAKQIHSDRIDILIDLAGHTAHNRLPVFAWKPAPVQVSWLGYFATTGVAAIDYLIADPWTLPPSEEAYFTEKIWRLEDTRLCFTLPDAQVSVSPLPALDNGYITFGCFNNLAKMNDTVVALWARLLHAIPTSRLFLKSIQIAEPSLRQEIGERFAAHGIDASRLILEAYGPRADYLAAYQRVDIALDPFPFPGGTTTVEALWMGVPVLTLTGERFLSRQGVGLMMNAGLTDWIAADHEDYVARAVAHASELQNLATLRAGLRQQVLDSPIFDATRFAKHFAAALRGMWKIWCEQNAGVLPQTEKARDGAI